jgi:hypothetical protein
MRKKARRKVVPAGFPNLRPEMLLRTILWSFVLSGCPFVFSRSGFLNLSNFALVFHSCEMSLACGKIALLLEVPATERV